MDYLSQLTNRASGRQARILFVESLDERIQRAALALHQQGILSPVLLGEHNAILAKGKALGIDLSALECQAFSAEKATQYTKRLCQLRQHKGLTPTESQVQVQQPLMYANLMLDEGIVDGLVAGATYTTADVVRSALQVIGKAANTELVSSFFIMVMPQTQQVYIFSDCALVVEPSAVDLVSIGQSTIQNATELLAEPLRIALLSFSTDGSAKHPAAEKVAEATQRLKALYPEHCIDGEIQLDAAIVPAIAQQKMPNSSVEGQANVLIFPSLEAGNIGYKLVQQFGQGLAIGPILQGLRKPVNDLSRGCTWQDVFYTATITALQVGA